MRVSSFERALPIIGVTAGIDRGAVRAESSDTTTQASLAAAL